MRKRCLSPGFPRNRRRYLGEHRVFEKCILPAAAMLEMALAAGVDVLKHQALTLREVTFQSPLELNGAATVVQTVLRPPSPGSEPWSWKVCRPGTGTEERWTTIAAGAVQSAGALADVESPDAIRDRLVSVANGAVTLDPAALYDWSRSLGLDYGPSFQCLRQIWRGPGEALGCLQQSVAADEGAVCRSHPVLLDASFQLIAAADDGLTGGYMPVALRKLTCCGASGSAAWGHARLHQGVGRENTVSADVTLFLADGSVAVAVEGLTLQRVSPTALGKEGGPALEEWLYQLQWRPQGLQHHSRALSLGFYPRLPKPLRSRATSWRRLWSNQECASTARV